MKNKQKNLLSKRAIGSIFAIVLVVTLSGYGLEPIPTETLETAKTSSRSGLMIDRSLPALSVSSAYAKTTDQKIKSRDAVKATISAALPKTAVKKVKTPISTLVSKPVEKRVEAPLMPELTNEEKAAKIRAYFSKYNLPLKDYGEKFVEISHYCDIDWALLPAIGMQESTGGKFMRNNNPFGWGSARIPFKDFNEAIEVVGGHLCGKYESTDQYYKDKTTAQKLWYYNGSVNRRYPGEVMAIMNKIKSMPIDTSLALK